MLKFRVYGNKPNIAAAIHGGPGAPGTMAPVAKNLSLFCGTLEPLQTAVTIDGQIEELRAVIEEHGDLPLTLIGHSWGAWLSFIFAARYPSFIRKLILIGSGPFEAKYAEGIMEMRFSRLNGAERIEVQALMEELNNSAFKDKAAALAQFGQLMAKTDSFKPLPCDSKDEVIEFQSDIYQSVWQEAAELRRSGELLKLGLLIQCPVVAIHGDYDPHPADGVERPLSQVMKDFRFILLKNCGHEPWNEQDARKEFYSVLENEL